MLLLAGRLVFLQMKICCSDCSSFDTDSPHVETVSTSFSTSNMARQLVEKKMSVMAPETPLIIYDMVTKSATLHSTASTPNPIIFPWPYSPTDFQINGLFSINN